MDAKRLAMVIGIIVLLPLFLGLFVDAMYQEPKYNDFCNDTQYMYPAKPAMPTGNSGSPVVNCTYTYDTNQSQCYASSGQPRFNYDVNGCETFSWCDYCSNNFSNAQQLYNRNIFFILMPVGLLIVILGIYVVVDYIGAGLMFAGLITMFYATVRYFSDMSKLLRAIVVLVELLIILWIGYKKIGRKDNIDDNIDRKYGKDNSRRTNTRILKRTIKKE
jgi:hypothetical protein